MNNSANANSGVFDHFNCRKSKSPQVKGSSQIEARLRAKLMIMYISIYFVELGI